MQQDYQDLRDEYHILSGKFAPSDWGYNDFTKEIQRLKKEIIEDSSNMEQPYISIPKSEKPEEVCEDINHSPKEDISSEEEKILEIALKSYMLGKNEDMSWQDGARPLILKMIRNKL